MNKYEPSKLEPKWQKKWEDQKLYAADDAKKDKEYLLIEFPYPSGDGLHVGHVRSYTAMDIVARKRRMEGKNVLYPIGWDAFGLPTENYAIKTGIHPKDVTKQNTDTFRRQLKSLGYSFDWDREINTTNPEYYKWTQWMFIQFFKHDLAYKANVPINWCLNCKIGLANEEVVSDRCERCGGEVEKRNKDQWMIKITQYADKLLEGLKDVDYISQARIQQENWIGRSEGAELSFEIKKTSETIDVFTTRPDTLFGATYMVLAPEHRLIETLGSRIENIDEVKKYISESGKKTELERTADEKEKTGVELKGVTAINPATQEEIPVFIADYVLASYGTGAIMAVPAHDERDYQFAKKYDLPIRKVVEPKFVGTSGDSGVKGELPFVKRNAVCAVIRNPKNDTYLCNVWKNIEMRGLLTGGVRDDEDKAEAALREIQEETGYKNLKLVSDPKWIINTFFYHRQKEENRWARFHFLFFDLENEDQDPVDPKEAAKHEFVWKKKGELQDFFTVFEGDFVATLLNNPDYVHTGTGILGDSGEFNGMESEEAKKKITKKFGTPKVQYKLRDWVFSRQRYWGEPIPLVHCEKCDWVPVPDKELPVELPEVENYQPTDTGESPLAAIESFVNTTCPKCKGPAKRETDVMPNWAGSSWYFLRYIDPKNDNEFTSKKKMKHWMPVDWYNGGMEHTTLHLLYSRFWNMFLYDIGFVPVSEPYAKRTSHGFILGEGGIKMSKSKGNVVNPDDLIEKHGADALRLYEMFIGPFNQTVAWDPRGILGPERFLHKVWSIGTEKISDEKNDELEKKLHQTIKKISDDVENMSFNTAISTLMMFVNACGEYQMVSQNTWKTFLSILAPFAPHIAEELWEQLGEKDSIHKAPWPKYNPKLIQEEIFELVIQINGKVRTTVKAPSGISQTDAEKIAKEHAAQWLDKKNIKKTIFVPDRLINFIV